MKIITIAQKPLLDETDFERILDVPKNVILDVMSETREDSRAWYLVRYREEIGWLQKDYTDPYITKNAQNVIDMDLATDTPNDPAQFFDWHNTSGKQIVGKNGCGQICVTRILELPFSQVLRAWEKANTWFYQYVYQQSDIDRGTDEAALLDLLSVHGVADAVSLDYWFMAGYSPIFTAYRFAECLKDNYIIYGVSIDQSTGELVTNKQIAHWILLESAIVDGNDAVFTHFNPFYNGEKQVSYDFMQLSAQAFSGGGLSGLVVPRIKKMEKEGFGKMFARMMANFPRME